MAITKRQKHVLDFVAEFIVTNQYSPSFEEVARSLSLSSIATVHKHLLALEEKGYLSRDHKRNRSLEVTEQYYRELEENEYKLRRFHRPPERGVPLVGAIAAGQPLEAYEDKEELSFASLEGTDGVYALRVNGQSMVEDHILDGDYVLIEKAARARNGEIVVALVDGSETTLKRFFLEGAMVRLQPANMAMDPIILPAERVEVQGRLLAVHRQYH